MRKVVAAGSILVDKINEIGAYPKAGELTQIRARARVPGGLVPNAGCDIRILDARIPVAAFGAVGDDDDGRFAVAELKRRGLDTSGVVVKPTATSFTDVMSVPGGERTFFTYPGASAEWGYDDFPFEKIEAGDLVLLGYFLLLAKIDAGDGLRILKELKRRGLDTSGVVVKPTATSFTDVMSVPGGERTFFTYPGASADWGYDDFPFDLVQAGDLVLLGYFLLLAKIDAGDGLRILRELRRRGVETAIDLVSENSDRYSLVRECLPFVDNLIVNEIEAARIAGMDGVRGATALTDVASRLFELGVQKRVVIHMPEKGVSLLRDGTWTEARSVGLPNGFIKGKTGAGDAYCAGCLVGIFNGLAEKEILELGGIAAVGAMSAPGAVEGMRSIAELKKLVSTLTPDS